MAKITGIAHYAITCKDMEKSLDFYTRVLGFKKAFDLAEPKTGKPWINYLYMGAGQFVELFYNGIDGNEAARGQKGFNHICLEIDDLKAYCEGIHKTGYKLDVEPNQGSDFNLQAWITDPDGVRIELMQIDPKSPQAKAIQEYGK
jgi:lactoylglutathione lyase